MKMESNCSVRSVWSLTMDNRDINGAIGHEEAVKRRSIASYTVFRCV